MSSAAASPPCPVTPSQGEPEGCKEPGPGPGWSKRALFSNEQNVMDCVMRILIPPCREHRIARGFFVCCLVQLPCPHLPCRDKEAQVSGKGHDLFRVPSRGRERQRGPGLGPQGKACSGEPSCVPMSPSNNTVLACDTRDSVGLTLTKSRTRKAST